jgi:hypothetical protein
MWEIQALKRKSNRMVFNNSKPRELLKRIEVCQGTKPCEFFTIDALAQRFKEKAFSDISILYIGGSLNLGTGLASAEDVFLKKIHQNLVNKWPSKTVTTINFIRSFKDDGKGDVQEQLEKFYSLFANYNLDLVLPSFLKISSNDLFAIMNFIEFCQEKKIKVSFIETPISSEVRSVKNTSFSAVNMSRSDVINKIIEKKIPIFRLDIFFYKDLVKKSGFIWQDSIHPTGYGHSLLAKFLTPRIINEINRN